MHCESLVSQRPCFVSHPKAYPLCSISFKEIPVQHLIKLEKQCKSWLQSREDAKEGLSPMYRTKFSKPCSPSLSLSDSPAKMSFSHSCFHSNDSFRSHGLLCFLVFLAVFPDSLRLVKIQLDSCFLIKESKARFSLVGGKGTSYWCSYINVFFLPHLVLSTKVESREARAGGCAGPSAGQSPGSCGLLLANGISVVKQRGSTGAERRLSLTGPQEEAEPCWGFI